MTEPIAIPEWVATLVGRLVLENEAMRQASTPPPTDPAEDNTPSRVS